MLRKNGSSRRYMGLQGRNRFRSIWFTNTHQYVQKFKASQLSQKEVEKLFIYLVEDMSNMLLYYFLIIYLIFVFRTNLPKEVMGYPDYSVPDNPDSYLTRTQILEFLNSYCDHFNLRQYIQVLYNLLRIFYCNIRYVSNRYLCFFAVSS